MSTVPKLQVPSIGIAGSSQRFPVRRIFCVGQNYAAHAREMGADPDRRPPFFFSKPADAVVPSGSRLPFPLRMDSLHHEVELVIALNGGGVNLRAVATGIGVISWNASPHSRHGGAGYAAAGSARSLAPRRASL